MISLSTPSESALQPRENVIESDREGSSIFAKKLQNFNENLMIEKRKLNFHPRECNLFVDALKLIREELSCNKCHKRGLRSDGFSGASFRFICKNYPCKATQSGSDFVRFLPEETVSFIMKSYNDRTVNLAGKWGKLSGQKIAIEISGRKTATNDTICDLEMSSETQTNEVTIISSNCSVEETILWPTKDLEISEFEFDNATNLPSCKWDAEAKFDNINFENIKNMDPQEIYELLKSLKEELKISNDNNLKLRTENIELKNQLRGLELKNNRTILDPMIPQKNEATATKISYASIAALNSKPKPIVKPVFDEKSIDKVFKEIKAQPQAPESEMKLIFFKGCKKTNISFYRNALAYKGFRSHLARDFSFLTDEILQVLTYESEISNLVDAMCSIHSSIKHLPSFDPTAIKSYDPIFQKYLTVEDVKSKYFKVIEASIKRLEGCLPSAPSLSRSINFLKKVLVTKNLNIGMKSRESQSKGFFLSSYISFGKGDNLSSPEPNVISDQIMTEIKI